MNNVIVFKNVSKTYKLFKNDRQRLFSLFSKRVKVKKKKALRDVSFSIERGEAVALFGKNGAGKSTLLKIITGVCYPNAGEVEVNGVVSALLELKSGFDSDFTGRENIYLKGQLMGLSNSEISEQEQAIIDFAELEEYIDQPIRTYSSGMKARLGFSIAINVNPEILIVDETLSVGDAQFKKKCYKKVNEIMSSGDVTLLFVSHSESAAQQFCKRGIVLEKGEIIFDGEISEAAEYYNSIIENSLKELE